ncbi:MAG: hypothetical protein R3E60_03500 [Alphaproteobacteria bacterium]
MQTAQALDVAGGGKDVEIARKLLREATVRTKTKQISGGDNINVMEFAPASGQSVDGAIVYFKKFGAAFKFANQRFGDKMGELPQDWDGYKTHADAVKAFAGNDVKVANAYFAEIFEWFKARQKTIGDQGGVLIVYEKSGRSGAMVAYADRNSYPENAVASVLSSKQAQNKIIFSPEVFRLKPNASKFFQEVFEDPEGSVKIANKPYEFVEIPEK